VVGTGRIRPRRVASARGPDHHVGHFVAGFLKTLGDDFAQNVTGAAGAIWDGWGYPKFSQESVWAKAVTPKLAGGDSLVDLLPTWEKALKNEAQANGYKVS